MKFPRNSFDGFARERNVMDAVRFIKIDVQGYEPAVVQGLQEALRRNAHVSLAIEYMPEAMRSMGFDPDVMLNQLRDGGFVPMVISR